MIIMGRIKTKDIKRTGEILFEKKPEKFSADFEANKNSVRDMKIAESKRVRNKIAGYIVRKKKQAERIFVNEENIGQEEI